MNAKLIVEGKEFEIEILDPQLKELLRPLEKMRRTGYERTYAPDKYYYVADDTFLNEDNHDSGVDNMRYDTANYYSDKTVATNNARADRLMRQLRRFAAEHRKEKHDRKNTDTDKFKIMYDHEEYGELVVDSNQYLQALGAIYFDSSKTAQQAIGEFHDELIWYFTEYKDSL